MCCYSSGLEFFFKAGVNCTRLIKKNGLLPMVLYSFVRQPQYSGLFLALFGKGVVHWPTFFSVGLFPTIVLAYTLLPRKEEQKVTLQFGEEYLEYKRHVPMFIPMRGKWRQAIQYSNISSDNTVN